MSAITTSIICFLIVFSSVNAVGTLLRVRARKTERRLLDRLVQHSLSTAPPPPALVIDPQIRGTGLLAQASERLQRIAGIQTLLERAGEKTTPAPLLRLCAIAATVPSLLFLCVASGPMRLAAVIVFIAGGAFPVWRVTRKAKKRLAAFEAQFPDGLQFIARSMRAGHAFSVSLEMLYQEFDEPMAGEFRRTFEEQNLGLPLEVALAKFAERIPLVDVRFFASAVLLQRKTGGNLTEILDNLAHLIRERYKLRGKVRAVSAHGRMTGKALSAIPILVGVLMFFMNPDYAAFFVGTTTGNEMILACVALQVIGYLVIQRIVNIEV